MGMAGRASGFSRFWNILPDEQPAQSLLPVLEINILGNRLFLIFHWTVLFRTIIILRI
jgi:hypothetical protein